jgi:FixJ family two-component response regulator
MILTGRADHTVPARALLAGATYLEKPPDFNALRKFVTDAMARARGREAEVHRVVSELTTRCKLTPTERAIIEGRIIGLPKNRLRDGRILRPNTANTHHAHIRDKTGVGIPELVERALREIFGVTLE